MPELRRLRPLLGTYVEVGARAQQEAVAEAAIAAAYDSLALAQARWSFHDPVSELSRLNARPGQAVPLAACTLRLLRLARAMTAASGGRFNCTVGGALVLRGALPDHGPGLPLHQGDADDLELGGGWARLRRAVRITLDGIAKGYAVDLAVQALRRAGAEGGWVNAGGDLRVFGDCVLPVSRRESDGRTTALGRLRNAALASSRAASRPSSDFPACLVGARAAEHEVLSVLARSAWRADALTKVAAALADDTEREHWVSRLGGHCVKMPVESPA
jgi:thiamine biosynthesis lipoprotein